MDNRDAVLFAIHTSLGVLSVIIAITTACYCKVRMRLHAAEADEPPPPPISSSSYSLTIDEQGGLDESTLRSFPKLLYSFHSKLLKDYNSSASSCCSICLADYNEKDMLRVLPGCRHLFHVNCVDTWLRLHPTCPLCRT